MWVAKTGYIVMSLVFCAAGIACIANPGLSAAVIGRVLGAAMILFGAVKLVGYCSRDLYRLAFQYDLGFGLLLIALGALVLLRPAGVLDFLFTALGIAVLTDGLYKVQIAVDAKRFGIPTWWLTLTLAMVTGAVYTEYPLSINSFKNRLSSPALYLAPPPNSREKVTPEERRLSRRTAKLTAPYLPQLYQCTFFRPVIW